MSGVRDLKGARRGAEWALAVGTAQELGLLEALAGGPRSLEELAAERSLSRRGTTILLGVLEALALVRRDEEGYRLTGAGRARYVDRDTPDHEAAALRTWMGNVRLWASELGDAVRSGAPADEPGEGAGGSDAGDLGRFMATMDQKSPELVRAVADACVARLPEGPRGARGLDLGGGPGTFSRALAERGLRMTVADRPEVIDHVGTEYGLRDRDGIDLWRGDFLESLPDGPFDLILAANISHIFDDRTNARLVARLAERLEPAGVLALMDFVRGESDFAPLFAVTMLLRTESGNTHGRLDYERWLRTAGLEAIRVERMDEDRHLVSARRPRDGGGHGPTDTETEIS